MFNVCSKNHRIKKMDTFFLKFIVVFGFLCTIGSAQYNVQPIPGDSTNSQDKPIETIVTPKLSANKPAIINTNSNTAATGPVLDPPLVFPKENTSYHFYKNETIEDKLLLGSTNHTTVENGTNKLAPSTFPTDSNKYNILENSTIMQHLLNATADKNITQNESTIHPDQPIPIPPPAVFPTDTTKYRFLSNKTAEDVFLSKNSNHVDTEVPDMLAKKHYDGRFDVDQIDPNFTTTAKTVIINSKVNNTVRFEDTNKAQANVSSMVDKHFGHDHLTNGKSQVAHGPLAGILIGVLLLVALVGYVSLVLWRRSLEIKYGTRERLVNEEDFDPHYDNRFEL